MIRIEAEVDNIRRELLYKRLRDTNTAASPILRALRPEREQPLHLWATDDDGTLVGGLVGRTWATWMHVAYLWVEESHRGAGLGSRLLAEAEHLARTERACRRVRLETWDFQAPDFYRKQGYEVVCTIPDYPPGITEYTLVKRLD